MLLTSISANLFNSISSNLSNNLCKIVMYGLILLSHISDFFLQLFVWNTLDQSGSNVSSDARLSVLHLFSEDFV